MPYAPWNAGGYYPFSPQTYGSGGTGGSFYQSPYSGLSASIQAQQNQPQPTGANSLPNYNINPGFQGGQGAYGQVPGPIGIPPSTYQQATTVLPGLGTAGTQATDAVLRELQGDISSQALRNIQDAAAQFGVSSGMPGSNAMLGTLAANKALLGNYRTTEQLQQQGLQNYNNLLGAVGQQQISPALAAEIAAHNAQLGAAPNPQAAAQQQLANYFASLAATRGLGLRPGGGGGYDPAGGTGRFAVPSTSGALGFPFGSLGQQNPQNYNQNYYGPNSGGFSPDMLYPGTELANQPNLSALLGPVNPYYNTTPSPLGPTGTTSYYPDASNPDYWNMSQNDFGLAPQGYNDWQSYYDDLGT